MGAGASALSVNSNGTVSMFEALKAQEEAKMLYMKRVSEVIAKEFNYIKDKGNLSQEDLTKEIQLVLEKNEPYIVQQGLPVASPTPVTGLDAHKDFKRGTSFSENKKKSKGARRRSFDNLVHEDIMQRDPKSYDDVATYMNPSQSGRIAIGEADSRRNSNSGTSGRIRINSFVSEGGEHYSNTTDPDAHFRRMCVETCRQIALKKNLTLMAAVDGSDGGHIAFETMMSMKKRLDHVCVFHAFCKETADDLPEEFKPDAVRLRYESELIAKKLPTTKFTFYWEEKKNRDIRTVMVQLLNNYKGVKNPMRPTRNEPNFFFCGHTGIKGGKVGNSTLGSVTDIALRAIHMPIIICKFLCESPTRTFVIAVDGTEPSRNGFDIAMALVNPKDRLLCVTVTKDGEDEDNSILDYYSVELQSYGPSNSEFLNLKCAPTQTVAECLVAYSDSVGADFFAISPRARPIFTSVTEYIITTVKANIILCKN